MKPFLYLLIFVSTISSCSIYSPQVTAPVLVEEKGDLQLSTGINIPITEVVLGLNLNLAYALPKNIQIQFQGNLNFLQVYQFQGMLGYNFKFGHSTRLRLFTGYFIGGGDLSTSSFMRSPERTVGYYHSIFTKLQFTHQIEKSKSTLGATLTIGSLHPNYRIINEVPQYDNNEVTTTTTRVTGEGILIEPMLFYHRNFTRNFSLTLTLALSHIRPITLNHNKFASFGISFNYVFPTIKSK